MKWFLIYCFLGTIIFSAAQTNICQASGSTSINDELFSRFEIKSIPSEYFKQEIRLGLNERFGFFSGFESSAIRVTYSEIFSDPISQNIRNHKTVFHQILKPLGLLPAVADDKTRLNMKVTLAPSITYSN